MKQFIGKRQVKSFEETTQTTPGGVTIIKVNYEDETSEYFSKLMFDNVISDSKSDDTELREKRVKPVVEMLLHILREWGMKTGELPYMSTLLNQSLDFNADQALLKLVSKYTLPLKSLDDIDMLTIDRILKDG